jgi:hypothetical protein
MAVPRGVARDKQLVLMARALDSYCRMYGIDDPVERDVAAPILKLFDGGFQDEATLLAELKKR